MHRFDTNQLVLKVKVEILTINELWSLFFVKRYQFYRKARLTCLLYRSTKDICTAATSVFCPFFTFPYGFGTFLITDYLFCDLLLSSVFPYIITIICINKKINET